MTATASDVAAMLTRHYLPEGRPAGGILAVEVGAPDGRRRADAIWGPFTIAGGPGLVGHEIKVTRSDVLAELADPTKSEPWAQYCTRWWLTVSDPALVDGLDVPEAWGIMAPPSGRRTRSMTVIRPAPKRKVGDTGPAWRRLLAWHHYRTVPALAEARRTIEYRDRTIGSLQEQIANRELLAETRGSRHATRVAEIVRAIEALPYGRGGGLPSGMWIGGGDVTDADVIAALTDLARIRAVARQAQRDLDRLVRAAEDIASPFRDVRKALQSLEIPTPTIEGAA